MSPEQARGRAVDKRTDIWAFGCVLYEMLAGRRAFAGDDETVTDILSAVLTKTPDWSALPAATPAAVHRLLRRCLEKDPKRRLRDIGDAVPEIDEAVSAADDAPAAAAATRRHTRILRAALLLLAAAAIYAAGFLSRGAGSAGPSRWQAELFSGPPTAFEPRISPDGQTIAFQAMVDGNTQVAVLSAGASGWRVLTTDRSRGTVGNISWSPDGSRIYFDRLTQAAVGIFSVSVHGEDLRPVLDRAMAPLALPDGSLVVATDVDGRLGLARVWPNATPIRTDRLGAVLSTRLLTPPVAASHDGRRLVFYGKPAATPDAPDDLYVIDLASGATRQLAAGLAIPTPIWTFPLSATNDRVLFVLPDGDLRRVVSVPWDAAGAGDLETLFSLTQRPLYIDAGRDGAVYIDQIAQPNDLFWYVPSTRTVMARQTIGIGAAALSSPPVALPDGRVLLMHNDAGRTRVMVHPPGKPPTRFVQTGDETSAPVMLGTDRVVMLFGSVPKRRVAVVSVADGQVRSFLDVIDGNRVGPMAASADGRSVFYSIDAVLWRLDVDGGSPIRIGDGVLAAVEPDGRHLVAQTSSMQLVRIPASGGDAAPIPVNGDWQVAPGGLGPNAVGPDGRIAARMTRTDSWYWPLGILDPRTGRVEIVDAGPQLDVAGGWAPDGRIVAAANSTLSTLWRYRIADDRAR
jgi:Tol biopolymer transport system component